MLVVGAARECGIRVARTRSPRCASSSTPGRERVRRPGARGELTGVRANELYRGLTEQASEQPGRASRRGAAAPPSTSLGEMSFYVTTPIYYVNAAPHLGHAYTTIAADVLARHHRQRGERGVLPDRHRRARRAGGRRGARAGDRAPGARGPQRRALPRAGAAAGGVQRLLHPHNRPPAHGEGAGDPLAGARQRVCVQGHLRGLVLPALRRLQGRQRDRGGQPLPDSPHRADRANRRTTTSSSSPPSRSSWRGCTPSARTSSCRAPATTRRSSFIRSGLRDVPLTRHKLTWGVPVPWDPEHVFYVWFDALLNYYTALSYAPAPGGVERSRRGSHDRVLAGRLSPDRQGHPALSRRLLAGAADGRRLELPEHVFVHGFLLMDGEKMSKSLGNVLDPFAVIERFGADALRFYLLRDVPFGQDGSVSTAAFEQRYESELANEYGNLASRTLAMVRRYRDGVLPAAPTRRRAGAATSRVCAEEVCDAARPRRADAGARRDLAAGAAPEPLRRGVRAVELAQGRARAGELDGVLASLAEGLRVVSRAAPPLPAGQHRAAAGRAGCRGPLAARRPPRTGSPPARPSGELEPLFPKP